MGARHSLLVTALPRIQKKAVRLHPVAAHNNTKVAENQEVLTQVRWRAYEWWIRLGNDTANGFYANPIAGELTSPILETALQLIHTRDAIVAALFSNLWATFGFPSADAVLKLHEQITALRTDERVFSSTTSGL